MKYKQVHTVYLALIRLSGYPFFFSVNRLSGRIVGDVRPDSRILTKIEVFRRVAKYILENKGIFYRFHTFTTSLFKNKGALTQMK